ncbi:MAG: hypothetical protein K0R68_3333, partial [Mycobacterium sp.]|nr:hypothetical protein [Mycobacterium sp.]
MNNELAAPGARTMGALVREIGSRWPDHPAVIFNGEHLSFGEFDTHVDRWARGLLALGVRRGDCVAVLIGNRPEWLVATMAAARIGALIAPINTWYRGDELAYALEHSRAVVLVVAAGQAGQDFTELVSHVCPRFGPGADSGEKVTAPDLRAVVGIDDARPALATSLADFLAGGDIVDDAALAAAEEQVDGGDDLFLLYTSGSTARPKGVLLQHHSTIINDFNIGTRMGLDPGDRAWIAIPLFYGFAAVNAIVAVWSHGGALVLQERFDADTALDIIERERATVYYGLGNMTRSLLTANASRGRDISSLRKGLTGYSYED